MPRGGKREGAGRRKNTPNKASQARAEKVAATGDTPLDYMLKVMRDAKADKSRRDDMAKAAAPYVHPKFSSITPAPGGPAMDLSKLSDDELAQVERISRKLAAAFGDPGGETAPGE